MTRINMKLLKFYNDGCGPCMVLEQTLNKLKVKAESIKVSDNEDLVTKYNVTSIPTLVIVDDSGEVIGKASHIMTITDVKQFLNVYDYKY